MACSNCRQEVELGFVEKVEDCLPLFASKTGGKPLWLDPLNLPRAEDLTCKKCGNPRVILLQLYAPIDHLPNSYHRTVYIFCCKNPACHSHNNRDSFLVLRCGLPRTNPFYEPETGEDIEIDQKELKLHGNVEVIDHSVKDTTTACSDISDDVNGTDVSGSNETVIGPKGVDTDMKELSLQQDRGKTGKMSCDNLPPLCIVCGCGGPKKCSRCHLINYCSREHQVIHWKSGHKRHCGEETSASVVGISFQQTLFEEFEIVTEPEPAMQCYPEKSESERMKEYHHFMEQQSGKSNTFSVDQASIDDVEKGMKRDKQFMTFRKRTSVEPDQVNFIEICMLLLFGCFIPM